MIKPIKEGSAATLAGVETHLDSVETIPETEDMGTGTFDVESDNAPVTHH